MAISLNPVFGNPKKTDNSIANHKHIDYTWLLNEALDEKTKTNLQIMIAAREKFVHGGRHPYVGRDLTLHLKGCSVYARSNKPYSTMLVYQEIFFDNEHQKAKGFDLARGLLIDIGANEGFYTIKMCKKSPNLKAICIEPSKVAFGLLKKNIELNKLNDRIKIIKAAVWSDTEKQTLLSLPANTSNAGLMNSPVHSPWLLRYNARKEVVRTVTLKEILNMTSNKVDLLKIDTEGSELEILKGGAGALSNVKRIVVEYHSEDLRRMVRSLLINEGFDNIYETRDSPTNITSGNLYFIKS